MFRTTLFCGCWLMTAVGFGQAFISPDVLPPGDSSMTGTGTLAGAPIGTPVPVYEVPAPVPVSSLVSPELLRGQSYKVDPMADPTGMLYSFKIESDFGSIEPQSLQMLRIRLAEFKAITRLQQLSEEQLFLQGVGKQLESTAAATGKALMNPVETLKRVPVGFKKFAGEIQAQQMVGQVYGESGSPAYATVKRELAHKLGVDPYSDNEPLQYYLNEVAKNQNRGKLLASIGTLVVGGGAGLALNAVEMNQEFNDIIKNKSAAQLQLDNRAALMDIGYTQQRADYFLTTYGYTAANCTAITRALTALGNVKGITGVLDTMPKFSGPESILFAQTQIQMAAQFHRKMKPLKSVEFVEGSAVWSDGAGMRYVFSPLEHLYWNERIDLGMSNIARTDAGPVEFWISGTATPMALSQLLARGITVQVDGAQRLWSKGW